MPRRTRTTLAHTGTVRWFDPKIGYGFLDCDHVDDDVFVHYSDIQGGGYKTLSTGQTVTFELHRRAKGAYAKVVTPLPESATAAAE